MATTTHIPHAEQFEPYLVAMKPAVPTPLSEVIAALRTVIQLDGLTEEEYTWLAIHGTERKGEEGALIFREGEPTSTLNFILKGEVHVRRRNSGPLALFIGRAGQMTGLLPYSRMKGYGGDGYTIGPVWVLDIHKDLFAEMLLAIPSMGQRCVSVLLDRVREVTRMEQQAEKLAALGKLAANLAHELNNPASAAQRAAATLFSELREYGDQKYRLGKLCLTDEESERYRDWITRARQRMMTYSIKTVTPADSPLAASDREEMTVRWLTDHGIPEPWRIAPALAETNLPLETLDDLVAAVQPQTLPVALATVAGGLRVERLSETILNSTVRIFDLISAIKDYSYMDQAPIQDIDLAHSLRNTLSILSSRLAHIKVVTDFDPQLPAISAYGSELNQVWTALIENAIDAMDDEGTLRLTTSVTGQMAYVEIWDTGHGIDPAIRSRIFEPFFTTKAPGHGLGLGLDTAQRIVSKHSGFLTVESKPGATCFQVRLPFDQAQAY